MIRRLSILVIVVAAATAAVWALGGDPEPADDGGVLQGGGRSETRPTGLTGPARVLEGAGIEGRDDPTLVGLPGAQVPGGAPSRRDVGDVVVRVVDAGGVPLANRVVSVYVDGQLRETVTTGPDGTVTLRDLPRSGGAFLALGRHASQPESVVRVAGPKASLMAANTVSFRVDLVDAESSAPLGHAEWTFMTAVLSGSLTPVRSGIDTPVTVSPGRWLTRPFAATPTPDYVDSEVRWTTAVSRFATSLRAVHPLRPEADVTVTFLDEGGQPVRDAVVASWHTAGLTVTSPQTGLALLGGVPLEGVPFHRGVPLRVWARSPGGLIGATEKPMLEDPHDHLEVGVRLRKQPPALTSSKPVAEDRDLPFEESLGRPDAPVELLGGIRIEVRRFDGRPATGARVRLPIGGEHRVGADGVLEVEGLLPGERVVRVDEPGFVPAEARVEIVAGSVAPVRIDERRGGRVVLQVEDAEGRGLPYAQVSVAQQSGTFWVALDGDEQRLDPYTDHEGRRILDRLEPGRVQIKAAWAGRRASVTVHVGDRETEEVTLRVP